MKRLFLCAAAALGLGARAAAAEPCAVFGDGCTAFEAWRDGDFDAARRLAAPLADKVQTHSAYRHHAAFDAYMEGRYDDALSAHAEIDADYGAYARLDRMVVDAHSRLGAPGKARDFLRRRGKAEPAEIERLDMAEAAPLAVAIRNVSVIPFVDDPVTPYLPGVSITINGTPVLARIDTGGTFLNMTRAVAERLGVKTSACVKAQASLQATESCAGVAARMTIGGAEIRNAPVLTAETLTPAALGAKLAVVIGANLLEQFLATLDYAEGRLIVSARGDAAMRAAHFAQAGPVASSAPFYLWGDHYMIVRGRIGDSAATFFFDTGLVAIDSEDGVQASLLIDEKTLARLGPALGAGPFRTLERAVAFGPLTQERSRVYVTPQAPVASLGGVRIDALLSHGFMKNATWTLDFDQRRIWFNAPAAQ